MRIEKSLPPVIVAALLGAALIGCQPQDVPQPKSAVDLPVHHGQPGFSAPSGPGAMGELPRRPGAGEPIDSQHPPLRRPGLIEI